MSATLRQRSRSNTPRRGPEQGTSEAQSDDTEADLPLSTDIDGVTTDVASVVRRKHRSECVPDWQMILSSLVDVLMWSVLYYRPYSDRYHLTISHYIVVVTVTDLWAYAVPKNARHWYQPFRLLGAAQLLALTMQLDLFDIDSPGQRWLTVLRVALIISRAAHALWCMWLYGPNTKREVVAMVDAVLHVKGAPNLNGLTFVAFVIFASPASTTHYNWGEARVDGPLAGFQAGDGVSCFVKLWVLETFMSNTTRAKFNLALGVVLLSQWPFMWNMFALAPRAYGHIVAELGLFFQAAVCFLWPR
jgi:hypothetical protein